MTIEGIAEDGELHPLQQKFLEHASLQCGICTPGFIVSAKALLDENASPSEYDVRLWLAGNLCRCTGMTKSCAQCWTSPRATPEAEEKTQWPI